MIKSFLLAFIATLSIGQPVWGEGSDVLITFEERVCHQSCIEMHQEHFPFVPFSVFMKDMCMPVCLERIECDTEVDPPICIDKGVKN